MTSKRCSRCKLTKPCADFNVKRGAACGLAAACRICTKALKHASYLRNKAHVRAMGDAWRKANPERRRAMDRAYHLAHRAEHLASFRAARAANRDARRQQDRDYYRANQERILAYFKRHRASMSAEQRAADRASKDRWDKRHRVYRTEVQRRRNARKRDAVIVDFTLAQLHARASVFGHRCAYCAGPHEEWDHVIPLSRGGAHALANLRPACKACNASKGARPHLEWLTRMRTARPPAAAA